MFTTHGDTGPVYLTAPNISAAHAFTTRLGGVSAGVYASWDLGENRGDDPAAVRENYRLLKETLGIRGGLVFSRQVHGDAIRVAAERDRREPYEPLPYEADGLITDVPGLPLIIFTADCVPVLLHDPVRGAVGAVHAGWRGAVADIAGKAVRMMADAFGCDPADVRAAIGPAIGPCCFETGPEVPAAVWALLGSEERITPRGNDKYMVDLPGVVADTLAAAGLSRAHIENCGECTKCLHEKYWSHRYTAGIRGSQASVIML